MKLHLPSGLRKAVMACLAAVAVSLPATLSSASLPAGALISFVLAQQVTMADFQPTDWQSTGDKYYGDATAGSSDRDWDLGADGNLTGKEYVEWTDVRGFDINVYGKGSVKTLKLTKKKLGGCANFLHGDNNYLQVENLWITRDASADGGSANYWTIVPRNGSTHSTWNGQHFFDQVGNFWINNTCFAVLDNSYDITGISTNLHLGASAYDNGISSNYDYVVFWMKKRFETTGYLDVVENTQIVLENGTLSVSNMQGSGNLIIGTVTNSVGTLKITGASGEGPGETSAYTGVLSFNHVGNDTVNRLAIELANGVTFDVKGLKTEQDHAGASFTVATGEGSPTATVKITNTDSAGSTAANMQFGEGVTLQIESNAIQTFTGTSSVSKLTGAGTLKIGSGTTTLGAFDGFTGTVEVAAGAMVLFNPGSGQTLDLTTSGSPGWNLKLADATDQAAGAGLGVEHGTVKYGSSSSTLDAKWQDLNLKATDANAVLEIYARNVSKVHLNNGSGTVKIKGNLTGEQGHETLVVDRGNLEVDGDISGYSTIEVQNRAQIGSMTVTGSVTMNDGGKFNLNYVVAALNLEGGLTGRGNLVLTGGGTLTIKGTISHSGSIAIKKGGRDDGDGNGKWGRLVLEADAASLTDGVSLSGMWQNEIGDTAEQAYQLVLAGGTSENDPRVLKKLKVEIGSDDSTTTGSAAKITGKWQLDAVDIQTGKNLTLHVEEGGSLAFGKKQDQSLTKVSVSKEGGTLTLDGGTYSGYLEFDASSGSNGGKLIIKSGSDLSGLNILLSVGSSGSITDGWTYQLMGAGWDTSLRKAIEEALNRDTTDGVYPSNNKQFKLSDGGLISIERAAETLLWNSDTSTGTKVWKEGDTDAGTHPWKKQGETSDNTYYFLAGDSVVFPETGSTHTVSISGSVHPATMTISGDGYTFSDEGTTNAAIIADTLTVTGGTHTINVPITVTETTTIGGENNTSKLTFGDAATLGTLSGFGEITFNGTTTINAINLTNDAEPVKTLTLKGSGTRTINSITVGENTSLQLQGGDVSFTPAIALAGKGTIEVGSTGDGENSRTLTLSAGTYNWTEFEGTLSVHGTLKLNGQVDITTKTQTDGNLGLGTIDLNGGKLWLATGNDAERTITANLKNVATIESKGRGIYVVNGNLTGSESCSSLTIKKESGGSSYVKGVKITGDVSGYNSFTYEYVATDGFAETILEFAGKLSLGSTASTFTIAPQNGKGKMAVTGSLEGSAGITVTGGGTLILGGTLTSATGTVNVSQGGLTLQSSAGFSDIQLASGTTLQLLNEREETSEQTVNKISLAGAVSSGTVNVSVNGQWKVKDLGLQSGAILNFQQTENGSATVTFGDDSSTVAKVGAGTLQLSSGTYGGKLEVTINEGGGTPTGGKIVLGTTGVSLSNLTISLNASSWLSNLNIRSDAYQLFENMTDDLLAGVSLDDSINSTLSAQKLQLKLNEQGQLTVLHTDDVVLTWSTSGGTWENKGETQWKRDNSENDYFANGDNVTFDSSESGVSGTVQLAGDVVAGDVTIKGTFSGAGSATSGWTFGASDSAVKTLTINDKIALDSNTQALFDEHVSVRLDNSQAEGFSITGSGDITFAGDMTGTATGGGKLVIGNGSNATVVRLTKGGANHQLGEVEVKQGSRLVISGFTTGSNVGSWADGSGTVYGDGAVVLAGTVTTSHYGRDASILKRLLSGNYTYDSASDTLTISHTLKDLYIGDPDVDTSASGMTMSFGNGDNTGTMHNSLLTVERLHVSEGAGLIVGNDNFFRFLPATMSGGPSSHTILLAGAGNGSGASHDAALVLTESITIDWDIEMEKNATIGVNSGKTVTVAGSFTVGSDKTFTKNGAGELSLAKFQGASASTVAGDIVVAAGKLNITGLSDPNSNNYVAKSVTVTATGVVSSEAPNSVAEFAFGSASCQSGTVDTVTFTGDTNPAAAQCTTNAAVRVADGATLTIGELDLTASNGTITGSDNATADSVGTIVIEGFKTSSGHSLRVGWAGEHVKVTLGKANGTFDLDGGLYLANGNTVTLASDGSIGWLGGNTSASSLTDGWNDIGGTITAGSAVTLTLDGAGKKAGNYTIDENVKLVIANSSDQQTFISGTIKGDIQIESGKTLAFEEKSGNEENNANTIESESELSGSGTLKVQSNGGAQAALVWKGAVNTSSTVKLEFATVGGGNGNAILQLENESLKVSGITMTGNGKLTKGTGNAKLTVNVADSQTVAGGTGILTVGDGVTLGKTGTGTQSFSSLTGETGSTVEVTEGVLQIAAGSGTWSVDNLKVNGNGATLDIARAGITATGTNITLAGGGKITDSATVGTGGATFRFGKLTLDGGTSSDVGKIEFGTGGTGERIYQFSELAGDGKMTLSGMDESNTGHTIRLDSINGFTGEIAGSVNGNCELQLGTGTGFANITSGDTAGSINLTTGAVTLNGNNSVLKKVGGNGSFTISELKLGNGQGLYMGYEGTGKLTITKLSFANDAAPRLVYGSEMAGNTNNRVEFAISSLMEALKALKAAGATVTLDTGHTGDSWFIDPNTKEGDDALLYLGITGSEQTGNGETYGADVLAEYFTWGYTGEAAELEWRDYNNQKGLYLSLLNHQEAVRYWDKNWDDGSAVSTGPNNKTMTEHADYWYDSNGNGLWEDKYETADGKASAFTGVTLQLGGTGDFTDGKSWKDRSGRISLRLTKGSGKEDTKLTIIGGKLYNDAASQPGEALRAPVYIATQATEKDRFHMLVGGSSFVEVSSGGAAGGYASSTHLQVMGGTIDFLIGGNHMSAGGATFGGDTYISVYEGKAQIDGNGDFVMHGDTEWYELEEGGRSAIPGGIVGGSTLTTAATAGNQFNGSSHIYIYTVLTTPSTVGVKDIMPGVSFSHIVGGNVWLEPTGSGTPTFLGSSTITIDLTGYQGKYEGEETAGTFDKAIVGGNYSASVGNGDAVATRTTVFTYDNTLGDTHPYASLITVQGTNEKGEAVTFRGGINGATRVDADVRENATYTGNTRVEIRGGAFQNYIAGGFWFGGMNYQMAGGSGIDVPEKAVYGGTFTGTTEVHLNGGEYWRAVGGHVSLIAARGSQATHQLGTSQDAATTPATKLVIDGGTFRSKETGLFPGDADLEGFVAGGSYYRYSLGAYSQTGASELEITGGVFEKDYKLAGGNVVKLGEVNKGDAANVSYTITGDTNVSIKGTKSGTRITGLVIGGGYMEDAGKGGSLTITGSTHVTISGGTIKAETPSITAPSEPGSEHLAIVAGSMLVDSGSSSQAGGHTVEIKGGTNLTISGGSIEGFVVGGSYTSNSAGENTITIGGNSVITLSGKGTTITGNIIGGHYSDNTTAPDTLNLGDVSIELNGATVDGYIFGGSFRRVTAAAESTDPTQGNISINLVSGTLKGGVYAAGNHFKTGAGSSLSVHTAGTRIEITGDVKISENEKLAALGGSDVVILSGGYQKALAQGGGSGGFVGDYSTVGYDVQSKTWNENAAALSLSSVGDTSFGNLKGLGERLYLQDFDTIDIQGEDMDIDLGQARMRVMHKVTGDAEFDKTNHDTFTKGGRGNLTLGTLWSWNAQTMAEEAYTGKIILGGGTLTLTGGGAAYEQSLEGGLMINMNGRPNGNAEDSYLKAEGDETHFTGLDEKKPITIQLVAKEFTPGEDGLIHDVKNFTLDVGAYYLVDGLDLTGIKPEDFDEYVRKCFTVTGLEELVKGTERLNLKTQLSVRDEDKLVLRIYDDNPDEWIWEGGSNTEKGVTWKANNDTNFSKEGIEAGDTPATRTYYFNAGAAYGEGEGSHVLLEEGIVAKEVVVESGDYTFRQENKQTLKVEKITVGGENTEDHGNSAELTLALDTVRVEEVDLRAAGTLTLADDKAIQSGTTIDFNGGTLAYGETDAGALALATDYSGQVAATNSGSLNIRVGNEDGEVDNDPKHGVTWKGATSSNNGVKLAVEKGIVKSGRMNFTLDWTLATTGNDFAGTLEAEGGTLTLKASGGQQATIKGGDKGSHLQAAKGATVELIASGTGSSLTVERAAGGEGTIAIGSSGEGDQGAYKLDAAVDGGFTGTIKLAGNAADKSAVEVNNVAALGRAEGKEGSTLALAGRAIKLASSVTDENKAVVDVRNITVEGLNYVGGYDGDTPNDVNKKITLHATDSITGKDGDVLANARGGYTQTLIGDLAGYTGAIVAGFGTDKVATDNDKSTWTLGGELPMLEEEEVVDGIVARATIAAKLAGTGRIIVSYGDPVAAAAETGDSAKVIRTVRLTGLIGDATMGTHVDIVNGMGADSAVVLANTEVKSATGKLVFKNNEIWLGDELDAGGWSGSTLAKDTDAAGGTFRLKKGSLVGIADKGGVELVVDTARGGATVNVGTTQGSLFDEININAGGKLREVKGDITVGENKTDMHLIFTEDNIGSAGGGEYLIGSTGKLIVNNTVVDDKANDKANDHFSFDLTNKALFTLLMDTRQRELQAMEEEENGLKNELLDNRNNNVATYLHLLTSEYTPGKDDNFNLISFADGSDEALNKLLRSGTYTGLLEGVGFTMSVDGGDLVLLGSSLDIYIVLNEEHDTYGQGDKHDITSQKDADLLSGKKATLLDEGTTLTLDLTKVKGEEEDAVEVTVNNLVGLSGSALEAQGEGTVVLNNAEVKPDPMEDDKWLDHVIDDQEHLGELKGQDTEFEGTIRGGEGVTFQKKGAGTLTVGNGTSTSGLQIEGTLKLTNGSVVVRSKESNLDTLTFDYGKDATVGKGLGVDGGAIYVDHIEEGEDATGKVTLSNGGTFIYKGTMTDDEEAEGADKPLVSTTFTTEEGGGTLQVGTDTENATLILGSDSEKGTSASIGGDADIVVNDGSTLKLQDQATMDAGQVELAGRLDMSGLTAATNTASALSGEGTLKGGELTQLTIDGQPDTVDGRPTSAKKAFSGTLEGAGTLSVARDAAVYFDGLSTKAPEEGGNKWNLDVESGATLDVQLKDGNKADLGNVTLHDDSNFVFHCNEAAGVANYDTETGFAGALKVEGGDTARANLTVDLNGWAPEDAQLDYRIKIGGLTWDDAANDSKSIEERFNDPKLAGQGSQYFKGSIATDGLEANNVVVNLDHEEQNMYKHANQEKNAAAGADIFWGVDDPTTASGRALRKKNKEGKHSDLYEFTYALGDKYQTSGAGSELDRMLTAGAGASIAVLGQALGDDLHRQLNSLRNRTTGMGSEARYDQYDMLPLYHMWVNGETGYHKLDADGLAPGYTLNSWGGTLGMEIDVSRRVTVGLALTAMYGDLKTDATDSASGDMDTTYMSAFVRGTHGAWSHTLVVTGGMADVKFNRTVGYDAPTVFGITMPASYKTSGSTDGYMVGAIYELGYTRMANAAGTVAIQPVFNVEIRHVGIQGYNETGSDAGLRVGDITQDTVTIGLGARVQALTGTNIFNRSAIFEGRALLKADVGDRSGKVVNAVLNTQNSAELESAEVGAVGVEIGAGISIPLGGTEGSIFIDGSLEWRSGYTSMDATIGYRVNF